MLKRIITLLLVLLMLAGTLSLFSCKKTEKENDTTADRNDGSDVVESSDNSDESEVDTTDYSILLDVPDELDYAEREFVILSYDSSVNEFGDNQSKNVVDKALVSRDSYIEQYLNVKLKVLTEKGQFNQVNDFSQKAITSISTGQQAYDMICAYSMVPSILTLQNVLCDVADDSFANDSENYIDLSKIWWPQYLIENVTVNGKTYSVSGDAAATLMYNLMLVMFDANMLEKYDIDAKELYNIVDNGSWTLEYMLDISKGISEDIGGNGWDVDDFYAISAESAIPFSGFYFGTGNRLVENEGGRLVVSDTIQSERAIEVFETIFEAVHETHIIRNSEPDHRILISSGNCLFEIGTAQQLGSVVAQTESTIGMLPFPKYSEGDTPYYSLLQNTHSHFCIPTDVKDPSCSSAVLETMGYASYETVTPVIYEVVMKKRYAQDVDSSRMFDIIRAGAMTDIGILNYFNFVANGAKNPLSIFRETVLDEAKDGAWVSTVAGFEGKIKATLNEMNAFYLG